LIPLAQAPGDFKEKKTEIFKANGQRPFENCNNIVVFKHIRGK